MEKCECVHVPHNFLSRALNSSMRPGPSSPSPTLSIMRHVYAIDKETLRATVAHAITRFKHVIDADGMHIEQFLGKQSIL